MEKIILCRMLRTKNDKIMLIFLRQVSDKNTSAKGYNENTQWIENIELFNKLEQNDFGKVIDANLGYSEPNYAGQCSIIIKDIIINGKQIKFE